MKSKKTKNKPIKNPPSFNVTDDSGVVISLQQYKLLHEDGDAGHGFSRSWGIGLKNNIPNMTSSFTEIAKEQGFVPQTKKVLCEECGNFYSISKIRNHMIYVHANSLDDKGKNIGQNYSVQPGNKEIPNNKNLSGQSKRNDKSIQINPNKETNPSTIEKRNGIQHTTSSFELFPENQEGNVAEAFRQAFDEKSDGSKGLGHFRREWDGKFGSYPLHDDDSGEKDNG